MEEVLHGRVIGQEEAVSAIARAIRRARVGLKNPNRPIASFIFAGPTGGWLCFCCFWFQCTCFNDLLLFFERPASLRAPRVGVHALFIV